MMLRLLLRFCCCLPLLGSLVSAAQSTVPAGAYRPHPVLTVRVNPLGFINKARAQAELTLGPVGLGVVGSYYYAGNFTGPKGEAYARYYTSRRLAEGFYVQAKVGGGHYATSPTYTYTETRYDSRGFLQNRTTDDNYAPGTQRFISGGGGGGVGYQFRLGAGRRVVLDAYVGLQYLPLPEGLESRTSTVLAASGDRLVTRLDNNTFQETEWYGLGPGAVFNSMLSIGYTFGGSRLGELPDGRRYQQSAPYPSEDEFPVRKASRWHPRPWAVRGN